LIARTIEPDNTVWGPATMVMIPLYDVDPLEGKTTPYVTYGLIATNTIVSVVLFSLPTETYQSLVNVLGLIPAIEFRKIPSAGLFSPDLTLVTSMFVHLNWWHLFGNMLFLWIFGDNVEDAMGHLRFFAFYILCGLAGAAAFLVSAPDMTELIGASGAIAGVLAAYLLLRPCAKVEVLALVVPLPVPAVLVIGLWMAIQFWNAAIQTNDGVGYSAHFGGAIAGALLVLVMRQPGVKLFQCMWPSKRSKTVVAVPSDGPEPSEPMAHARGNPQV
jgi:membrane associated rhomboid family serine protease